MSLQNLLDKIVIMRSPLFRTLELTVSEKRYQHEQEYDKHHSTIRVEARSFEDAEKTDMELQRRFLIDGRYAFEGYDSYLAYDFGNTGVFHTLERMFVHQNDPDKVKAIAIAACLYENRLQYRFRWLYAELKKFVGDEYWWDHPWKYTLPNIHGIYMDDVEARDRSIRDELIIERICNYLTRLIANTDFIELKTTVHQTAVLKRMIDDEQLAKLNQTIQYYRNKEERDREKAEYQKQLERRNQLHQWQIVSKQELERLVWTHTAIAIGEMYGISDAAVGKRCRSLGIIKPDLGFWRRVETGFIPHPKGRRPTWFKPKSRDAKQKAA